LQLADLEKALADAKSKLTAAVERKAPDDELKTLTTAASIAETDQTAFQKQVSSDALTKTVAGNVLTNRQSAFLQLTKAAEKADKAKISATAQLQTAMADMVQLQPS
jgi:hypothetical protein